jgi:hypothetical protein
VTTPFLEPKNQANLLKLITRNKVLQSLETSAIMNQSTGSNVEKALKLQHLKHNCGHDAIFIVLFLLTGTTQ